MALESRNHRGQLLDLYGKHDVYQGSKHDERYIVWFGSRSAGSFQGLRKKYRTLWFAIRAARKLERQGFDKRIADRLIVEETR